MITCREKNPYPDRLVRGTQTRPPRPHDYRPKTVGITLLSPMIAQDTPQDITNFIMDQQQTLGNLEYMSDILQRLVEQYLTSTPLPNADDKPVSITILHRLARHVVAEGYGQ